ncbi:hypothetical protein BOTBODRAFT_544723 [Botryobasidium botryosum FD-172 SS1]|uniref:BTB domain-containing protein n=1 Tax=Botryobasidium botryosum (strain FD-172 SS1) TaxID=930990 RepID=A0A067MQU7_BOTB1|nr:hypothetical protein BOTBODRAFT_544723 [Botryobasidium botryosum FD-172 SS1]
MEESITTTTRRDGAGASTSNLVAKEARRDSRFYFADGNVVILVDDNLFKVHRGVLMQDSSIFTTILSLPPPVPNPEGSSDENPFILHQESTETFRALLMVLYALPHEIVAIHNPETNIDDIVLIAKAAHKYGYIRTENWAADVLSSRISAAQYRENQDFLRLLDYAILSDRSSLRDRVFKLVMCSTKSGSINLSRVIHFAERKENIWWNKVLEGAYYRYALKGPSRWNSDPSLLKRHKRNLYIGYCTLVDVRQSSFTWAHVCEDEGACSTSFRRQLEIAPFPGPMADLLGWVDYVAQSGFVIRKGQLRRAPLTPCHTVGLDTLMAMVYSLDMYELFTNSSY